MKHIFNGPWATSLVAIVFAMSMSCDDEPVPVEDCTNGNDDDGDQQIDCDDADCSEHVICSEEICTNSIDDDGDHQIDCDDSDCSEQVICSAGDGDADADSDGDGDGDGDGDADLCERDCSSSPLYDHGELGDCLEHSTEETCCCVSSDITCHTVMTVGDMYTDLEVEYRGFYDDDHECTVQRFDSAGHDTIVFRAQTRGEACEYGFITVRVRAYVEELTLDQTYPLCNEGAPSNLNVTITIGEGEVQTNYTNYECPVAGEFVLNQLGSLTGQPYQFSLSGTLSEIDTTGHATENTAQLEVSSSGLVEVELSD